VALESSVTHSVSYDLNGSAEFEPDLEWCARGAWLYELSASLSDRLERW